MKGIEQAVADNWDSLISALYDKAWNNELVRYRSPFVFRGLSSKEYKLESGLIRLGGRFKDMEYHLLRNFRKYAELEGADELYSDWKWLALAQHRGLATRLLDWTFSPFVALHFATVNLEHAEKDGIVWCVNFRKAHKLLPTRLKKVLKGEGSTVFTIGMLARACKNLRDFDRITSTPFVLFSEPPSMDRRIVNQYALFSLMNSPETCMDEWLEKNPSLVRKVIVTASLKWEVRTKLDQANVTERVLFPGLDGLADWLNRHYGPYPKNAQQSAPHGRSVAGAPPRR